MKKYIMLAAVLYISVTAMAQTSPATSWEDSAKISLGDTLHKDTIATQSIMFRHKTNNTTTQFRYKPTRNIETGDGLIGVRDWIVRKRRWDEGRPLPPPTPVMRRR